MNAAEKKEFALSLFEMIIWKPLCSWEDHTIFHGDPHAGNIHAFRDPTVCRERSLRNAEEEGLSLRGCAALILYFFILLLEDGSLDLFSYEKHRVTRVLDPHLPHHLTDDDLDVFVVY